MLVGQLVQLCSVVWGSISPNVWGSRDKTEGTRTLGDHERMALCEGADVEERESGGVSSAAPVRRRGCPGAPYVGLQGRRGGNERTCDPSR